MSYETTLLEITTAEGVTIPLEYTRHEAEPRGLVMILPGRGYLLEHPALYYLSRMAAEAGYDVLGVPYSFQILRSTNYPPVEDLVRDAALALATVLPQRSYAEVVLAGKSLGTRVAVKVGAQLQDVKLRYLLLTPVMNSTDETGNHPTLAIIGTKDAVYDESQINADHDHPYRRWQVFEGLHHGLEYETGWAKSLTVMSQLIGVCESFLQEG